VEVRVKVGEMVERGSPLGFIVGRPEKRTWIDASWRAAKLFLPDGVNTHPS